MIYVEWLIIICACVDVGEISFIGLFFLAKCWTKALTRISSQKN
jgi:hypothetical protein